VLADDERGRLRRLATISPGMGFGEPAIVEDTRRTAFVRSDQPSVCWVLKSSAFHSLEASNPLLKVRLLENLLRSVSRILERLTQEAVADRS
jgi:glutaminase